MKTRCQSNCQDSGLLGCALTVAARRRSTLARWATAQRRRSGSRARIGSVAAIHSRMMASCWRVHRSCFMPSGIKRCLRIETASVVRPSLRPSTSKAATCRGHLQTARSSSGAQARPPIRFFDSRLPIAPGPQRSRRDESSTVRAIRGNSPGPRSWRAARKVIGVFHSRTSRHPVRGPWRQICA